MDPDDPETDVIVPYDTNGATPDARLYVTEGDSLVRIPIIDDGIETHIRKGGSAGLTRLTEAYVPREWHGTDIAQYIDAFDPTAESVYDKAIVQYYDETLGEYVTNHQGFVQATGGVGSSEPTEPEQTDIGTRIRVRDPSLFLDVISASQTFTDASIQDVLQYVRDEFVAAQPLWNDVPIVGREPLDDEVRESQYVPSIPFTLDVFSLLASTTDLLNHPETFTRNRDTLRDVMEWVNNVSDARVFFATQDDGSLALVYDNAPTADSYQAQNLGGEVRVRTNNAMYEIQPRNALRYDGRSKSSLVSLGDFELTMPADKYPSVTVVHEPTRRRAGETFYGRTIEGDALTLDAAQKTAKSRLKERLDEAAGGRIECDVTPPLRPYATIEATPACGGNVETEVPSYTYEIEEVTHTVSASDGARTDLRVSPHVALEDITVETSAMKAK